MKGRSIVLLLFVVLVSATATPALAQPKPDLLFVGSVGMATPITHLNMMVEVLDIDRSPYGAHDVLELYIDDVPAVAITDNAECAELINAVAGGDYAILVEDDELEVWRKGRRMFVELKEIDDLPFAISPLYIEFKGSTGAPLKATESAPTPTGYTMTMTYWVTEAAITFMCHELPMPCPGMGAVGHFRMRITPP